MDKILKTIQKNKFDCQELRLDVLNYCYENNIMINKATKNKLNELNDCDEIKKLVLLILVGE